MIQIKNLYKRYNTHKSNNWVLRNINLMIPHGTSVAVVGGNGAGKSTLLRLISGMDTPDKGEVIRACKVSWPIGLSGGFQANMTGRQNVKFVARVYGDNHELQKIIDFVQEFSEIGDAFDKPVRSYSAGMKSRLAFGLALAFDFDFFISDEATSVGDLAFRRKATKRFKERVGDSSIIMVSHSEDILKELCDSGIWLKDGQAIWFDKVDDAIDAYQNA